jgi:hypothetical protein
MRSGPPQGFPRRVPLMLKMMDPTVPRKPPDKAVYEQRPDRHLLRRDFHNRSHYRAAVLAAAILPPSSKPSCAIFRRQRGILDQLSTWGPQPRCENREHWRESRETSWRHRNLARIARTAFEVEVLSSGQSAAPDTLKLSCAHAIPELAEPEPSWHSIHSESACRLHGGVFICGHDGIACRSAGRTPQSNHPTFTLHHAAIYGIAPTEISTDSELWVRASHRL